MEHGHYIWKIIKGTFFICLFFMLAALMYQIKGYEKRISEMEKQINQLPGGDEVVFSASSEENNRYADYVLCYLARKNWDADNEWAPELAQKIEQTAANEFLISLKKGVKWHIPIVDFLNQRYEWLKGDHYVTAHDIKFTYDIAISNDQEYGSLKNIVVIDDYTLKFIWDETFEDAKSRTLNFKILPEFIYGYDEDGIRLSDEAIKSDFNSHWHNDRMIGCGPYRIAEHQKGVKTVLERNDEYLLGPKPLLKKITFLVRFDFR